MVHRSCRLMTSVPSVIPSPLAMSPAASWDLDPPRYRWVSQIRSDNATSVAFFDNPY